MTVFAIFLVGLFLFGISKHQFADQKLRDIKPLVNEEDDLTIWYVTDIHYLSPELFDNGEAFAQMEATSAGKDLRHIPEIMEALVWEAATAQPDLLIVSGDLTFNGEHQSMIELAEYFEEIEKNGTQVSVIPGNHDINSGWAREFSGDDMEKVDHVSPADFKKIFADFGYDLATSNDSNSLSYTIEPKKGYPLLMIDTNIYDESTQAPMAAGEIRAETFAWLDAYFEMKPKSERVFLVGHHPLLNHSGREGGSLGMQNAEEARAYFSEKGIKTSFAGHIHAQNISEQDGFHEIITGALSVYPNSIGVVTLSEDALHYKRKALDVESWATETGRTETGLLQYKQTSYDFFKNDSANMALGMMFEEQWFEEEYQEEVMNFIGMLNVRYFAGEDYAEDEAVVAEFKEHPGYQIIQANSQTFLKRYSTQLLQDKNLDDLEIIIPHR